MPNLGLRRHNMIYKGKPRKRRELGVKQAVACARKGLVRPLQAKELKEITKAHWCDACEL